jgi:hypothetical protein
MAFNAVVASAIDGGDGRICLHSPWIDDLETPSDPDVEVYAFSGEDLDHPDDPSDDFSGQEPFAMRPSALDGCGEPAYSMPVSVVDGSFIASSGELPVPMEDRVVVIQGAQIEGTLSPGGEEFHASMCGYVPAKDMAFATDMGSAGDMTVLEILLLGGAAFGFPEIPGVPPDIDVDGDGLERLVLDEDNHLSSCIDGDRTEILGRDCVFDRRIADGYSMVGRVSGLPAAFGGREPGWEDKVDGGCDGGPPDVSFFE